MWVKRINSASAETTNNIFAGNTSSHADLNNEGKVHLLIIFRALFERKTEQNLFYALLKGPNRDLSNGWRKCVVCGGSARTWIPSCALKDQASHETHAHQGWGVKAFVPEVGEKYVFKPLLSQLLIHTSTIIESPHRISGASVVM